MDGRLLKSFLELLRLFEVEEGFALKDCFLNWEKEFLGLYFKSFGWEFLLLAESEDEGESKETLYFSSFCLKLYFSVFFNLDSNFLLLQVNFSSFLILFVFGSAAKSCSFSILWR